MRIQLVIRFRQRIVLELLDRLAGQRAAVDKQSPLVTLKHDSGPACVANLHHRPVRIDQCGLVVDRHIVSVRNLGKLALTVDRHRARVLHPHRPLSDVNMMGAPVGHLPAGVLVPKTESVVAPLWTVLGGRGLPEPQVPIEMGRR